MLSFLRDTREKLFLAILFAAWLVSLVLNLETSPLQVEEPRRALIAQEMMLSGNYAVPTEKGEFYYKKPPLFNWVLIGSFRLFGEASEFAARIPTVISFVLLVLALFYFVRKNLGEEEALISALFFSVTGDIYFNHVLLGEIDVFFSLLSVVQMLSIWHFYKRGNYLAMFLVSWLFCAAGILTKGFPSLLFQGFTLLVVLWLNRDLKKLFSWQHIVGAAIGLSVLGIYLYVYSFYNNPANYLGDLWSQSSRRTVAHTGIGPLFLYFLLFPLSFLKAVLPAGVFAPLLADRQARRWIFTNEFLAFCFWALLANILVYWVSPGVRSRYLFMLYPFGVIILISMLLHYQKRVPKFETLLRSFSWGVLLVAIAAVVVAFFIPELVKYPGVTRALAITLSIGIAGCALVYFTQPRAVLMLVMVVVLGRLGFDLVVLPLRDVVGEHVEVYHQSLHIAEITKEQPLWLKSRYGDGVYPLESVFYIERSRQEVLRANDNVNCSDYFIAHRGEFDSASVNIYYSFKYRNNDWYVLKFRNCGGGQAQ